MTFFRSKQLLVIAVAVLTAACGGVDEQEQGDLGTGQTESNQAAQYATHAQGPHVQIQTAHTHSAAAERNMSDTLFLGALYDPQLAVYLIAKIVEEMPERLTTSLAAQINKEISKLLMAIRLFGELSADEFNELRQILGSRYELAESYVVLKRLETPSADALGLNSLTPQGLCASTATAQFVTLILSRSSQQSFDAALALVYCASQSQCAFCVGFKELLLNQSQ